MLSIRPRLAFAFGLLPLLLGCQNFAAITPGTSASALIERFGAPKVLSKNSDGSELWEYPRTPSDYEKFLIDIGVDRKVATVRQVLSDEYFSKVKVGMSREDVRRILGTPYEIATFDLSGEEVWTWLYPDPPAEALFNAHFDRASGMIRRVSRFDYLDKVMTGE
jgi:hypothetical protein